MIYHCNESFSAATLIAREDGSVALSPNTSTPVTPGLSSHTAILPRQNHSTIRPPHTMTSFNNNSHDRHQLINRTQGPAGNLPNNGKNFRPLSPQLMSPMDSNRFPNFPKSPFYQLIQLAGAPLAIEPYARTPATITWQLSPDIVSKLKKTAALRGLIEDPESNSPSDTIYSIYFFCIPFHFLHQQTGTAFLEFPVKPALTIDNQPIKAARWTPVRQKPWSLMPIDLTPYIASSPESTKSTINLQMTWEFCPRKFW
jgi:hypothetical protein